MADIPSIDSKIRGLEYISDTLSNQLTTLTGRVNDFSSSISDMFRARVVQLNTCVVPAGASNSNPCSTEIVIPKGYNKCITAIPSQSKNQNLILWSWTFSAGVVTYRYRNMSNKDIIASPLAYCLFVK